MFSVIVALYNKSAYLEKCLQSIFNQTFTNFELILINDGSTDDGTEKVRKILNEHCERLIEKQCNTERKQYVLEISQGIKESKKSILLSYIDQENSGVSTARNNGVKNAIYDYVAFLDADDWWEPTYLSEMKTLIEEYPGAGLYGSNYFLVKRNRQLPAPSGIDPAFKKGLIDYFGAYARTNCQPVWTGAVIVPKKVMEEEKGFNPELKLGEDFDLWVRIALKYPVAFLNKNLSNYNQDSNIKNRATGHLPEPSNHVLWNLTYLEKDEQKNPVLKKLFDNLRIYSLFPYYLNHKTRKTARMELDKVNWKFQPLLIRLKYKLPVFILVIYWFLKKQGSGLKKLIINRSYSREL